MLLNAVEHGEGPPVCLLHGLFGRWQNLGGLARRLSAQFRVVSLDLRNHGASPHAPGMDYPAMARDVLETLAALNALPTAVFGHSMGGKTAMMAALQHSAQISRLVVADIAPAIYAHRNAAVARALLALPVQAGLDRKQAETLLAGAVSDAAIRGFLLQNLVVGAAPHWRIGLDHIAAGMPDIEGWPGLAAQARYERPALFIAGTRSDYLQSRHWPGIVALFPAATLAQIDAGHWLHADQPEAFGRLVEQFLLA